MNSTHTGKQQIKKILYLILPLETQFCVVTKKCVFLSTNQNLTMYMCHHHIATLEMDCMQLDWQLLEH